jgi:hypothetical protein
MLLLDCGPDCTNTIISTIPSPNAQWTATIFTRDCGATTNENAQITLRRETRDNA